MHASYRRGTVAIIWLSIFCVAATILHSRATQSPSASAAQKPALHSSPATPQAALTDQQPPFDKLELFGLFAAGPIAPYANQVIHKRGCTFMPDATFIAAFPTPAFQEILENIKPRTLKKSSPDRDAAYALLQSALSATHHRQFAVSDENYQEALKLAPFSATLHLAYAANLLLIPDGLKAESEARRSLELWPDNAEAHGILSLAFMAQRNVAGAVAEARETLRIFPQHTSAKFQLAVALAQNHQYEEAIPALRNALLVLPSVPTLHKFLGISLLQTKQTDDAIAELTLYIHADPTDPEGHYFLGTTLRAAGRQAEADSQLQQAARLKSRNSQ
ncbi:MAG: tetratricopeptide repeat protein [Candidatus Acidiferrum sp.]